MALALKPYQQDCLDTLTVYLRHVVELNNNKAADTAFYEQTHRIYHPVPQLPALPYVCLRVPTGGGKTILAAHSIKLVTRHYLQAERSVVLWLAPTGAIVDQTLRALKDRRHPYRQVLDQDFGGNVSVLSIDEALYVQPGTLSGDTTVIVCTLQALRVNDTEGRKVYEANGNLMAHFTGLTARQIEELTDGTSTDKDKVVQSLANVLRLHHPIVIMDEAHNARTPLAFETFQRLSPSCILELTATPDQDPPTPSNVLYHCSAAQLKADGMIKLPIRLKDKPQWKEAVQAALAKRQELEELALKEEAVTGEYVRPIVLYQAQNESKTNQNVTAEVLKQSLIDDFGVDEKEVRIVTGKVDEIGRENVMDRSSVVRHIITVQKLREGWDCPFAYVLCSVTNMSSATAVEQILGRVLRLPYAKQKQHEALNSAYAYATSTDLLEAAGNLQDAIVDSGFTKLETKAILRPQDEEDAPLFAKVTGETFTQALTNPIDLTALPLDVVSAVQFDGANKQLTWTAPKPMTPAQKEALQAAAKANVDKVAVEKLYRKTRGMESSPAAMGELFRVPQLALRVGKQHELFEDQFAEAGLDLPKCDALLTDKEFALPQAGAKTAVIDVNQTGKVETSFIQDVQQQLALFEVGPSDPVQLARWMARNVRPVDVTYEEAILFMHNVVKALVEKRGFTLEQILSARFRLLDSVAYKIDAHRKAAHEKEYQLFLLPECKTPIAVTPEVVFEYPKDAYPVRDYYAGPYKFAKHYYTTPAAMGEEEAACAVAIDLHPKVKHWVRNLVRDNYAFSLRLAHGRFYPDFVAELVDGRYLVVEYKGKHLVTAQDALNKETAGKLWQARSDGLCVFLMATKDTMKSQLDSI